MLSQLVETPCRIPIEGGSVELEAVLVRANAGHDRD
jgi:hypothetical protein